MRAKLQVSFSKNHHVYYNILFLYSLHADVPIGSVCRNAAFFIFFTIQFWVPIKHVTICCKGRRIKRREGCLP
jgi:hypothetical protein